MWHKRQWRCPAATVSWIRSAKSMSRSRRAGWRSRHEQRAGRRWRWSETPAPSPTWPPSWAATGTQRTGRCSPGARRCWRPTPSVWARWRRSALMRPCSGAVAPGAPGTGAPPSWKWSRVSSSTLSLVATPRTPPRAGWINLGCGARASLGVCWTSRGVPAHLRRGAAPGRPGRRPVPRDPPRQQQHRRGARRAQNDTLGHRGRKDDPLWRARRLVISAHERLSERATPNSAARLPSATPTAKSAWRGTQTRLSAASMISSALARRQLRHRTRRGPARHRPPARAASPGPHPGPLAHPNRQLAPRPRRQRAHRTDQQHHQTRQTRRSRVPPLRSLPHPSTPLRRQTQLDTHCHPHSPLKIEAPGNAKDSATQTQRTIATASCTAAHDTLRSPDNRTPLPHKTRRTGMLPRGMAVICSERIRAGFVR